MLTVNLEHHSSKLLTIMNNIKINAVSGLVNIDSSEVCLIVDSIGYYFTINFFSQISQVFVVEAHHHDAIFLFDILNEILECLANIVNRTIMIKMIVLNVGDDCNFRFKFDK